MATCTLVSSGAIPIPNGTTGADASLTLSAGQSIVVMCPSSNSSLSLVSGAGGVSWSLGGTVEMIVDGSDNAIAIIKAPTAGSGTLHGELAAATAGWTIFYAIVSNLDQTTVHRALASAPGDIQLASVTSAVDDLVLAVVGNSHESTNSTTPLSGTTELARTDTVASFYDLALGSKAGVATSTSIGWSYSLVDYNANVAIRGIALIGNTVAATTIALSSGNNQSATVGTAVAVNPKVLVTDGSSVGVAGETITWAVTAGGGSTTAGTSVTDASGYAEIGWTLGPTAGTNTLTATRTGLTGSPVSFTATGTAVTATTIAKNGGDAQTATVNTALPTALTVRVNGAGNQPVAGTSVTFAVASGGGSLASSGTVTTNGSGIATCPAWTLGATVGSQSVTATSAGLTGSPLTFTATGSVADGAAPPVVPSAASLVLGGPAPKRQGRRVPALLLWRARDATLTALTGQTGSTLRTTAGAGTDSAGRTTVVAPYLPTWSSLDTDADGVRDALRLRCVGGAAVGDAISFPWTHPALAAGDALSVYVEMDPAWARTGGDANAPGIVLIGSTVADTADGKLTFDVRRATGSALLTARAVVGTTSVTASAAIPAAGTIAILAQLLPSGANHTAHIEVGTVGGVPATATSGTIALAGAAWRDAFVVLNTRNNGDQRGSGDYRLLVIARGVRTATELGAMR